MGPTLLMTVSSDTSFVAGLLGEVLIEVRSANCFKPEPLSPVDFFIPGTREERVGSKIMWQWCHLLISVPKYQKKQIFPALTGKE